MCDFYRVCGKPHKAKWQTSKRKRNSRGQFVRYQPMLVAFLVIVTFISVSLVGINTVELGVKTAWKYIRTYDRVLVVDRTQAAEIVTWQTVVKSMVKEAGLDWNYVNRLIQCESSWKPDAFHQNKNSVDRGLWQLNSFFYSKVSKDCSYDPICSTKVALEIIDTRGFGEWVCSKYVK